MADVNRGSGRICKNYTIYILIYLMVSPGVVDVFIQGVAVGVYYEFYVALLVKNSLSFIKLREFKYCRKQNINFYYIICISLGYLFPFLIL